MRKLIIALAAVAVVAAAAECGGIVLDEKNRRAYEFDLSVLHQGDASRDDKLWYRTEDNIMYYVNFCGPTKSCNDSDVSVCIRIPDGEDYKYVNGGRTRTQTLSIAEDPGQSPDSSVTVTFSNGDKCGKGYYQTKVYINCKKDQSPGYFYNYVPTGECEGTLYMYSVAGCGTEVPYIASSSSASASSSSAPSTCGTVVTDPKTHRQYEFDLSSLHQDDGNPDKWWYRDENNTKYYVNFCGPTKTCNDSDISVCIATSGGKHINGGRLSSQKISIAEDPNQSPSTSVTVSFDGEKCGNGYYKTKVYVNCQETADPGYFYKIEQPNECEAILYMWAAAGCGKELPYSSSSKSSSSSSSPAPSTCDAVITDPKTHHRYEFDLSPLHQYPSQAMDTLWYRTDDNIVYYVNFCGPTKSCNNSDVSVCIRLPDGEDYKFVNGGRTSTQTFSIAEDPYQSPSSSVTVTYSNGEKCGNGTYKTKIYVNCLQTANPGYFYDINRTKECEATLYMWSAAGCGKDVPYASSSSSSSSAPVTSSSSSKPVTSSSSSAPVSSSSSSPAPSTCGAIITDPKTLNKYRFNLSSLHQSDANPDKFWYRAADDTIYYVNFCGPTKTCGDNDTSVCILSSGGKRVSGGSTSTQKFSIAEAPKQSPDSSVTVTYSNGHECGNGTYKTKIYVNCKEDANPGFFYDIDEISECEAVLYMYSAAGCGVELAPSESSSPMGSKPFLSLMIIALVFMAYIM